MRELPAGAEVVVIGGGVIGLSAAFHLAAAGVRDVVLLERDALGEGSTCKAAGGVRASFSDEVNIRLGLRSLEAFRRFGADLDQEIDLHEVGYLYLLDDAATAATFEAQAELQNALGLPSRMIGVEEAARLSPLVGTEGLLAALWSPRDGHCTPESVVLGFATAARRRGVTIVTGCEVTGIELAGDRIRAVETARGTIRTDAVVCAAGAWSRRVGEMVGIDLPVSPLRRQVAVTGPVEGLDPRTPFTIDFSSSFYFHAEGGGLLMGMPDRVDVRDFDLTRSREWLDDLADVAARRLPALGDLGVRTGWAGLYEMSPDHNALVGEAPGVDRFLYATGFSGHGFLMGPAIGEVLRDLFLGDRPVVDVSRLSAERFTTVGARPEWNVV